MVIKMWRQEWRVEGFTLNYHTPEHFTRCHWQKAERVKPLWIAYRGILAVYFVLSLMYTVIPFGREIEEESQQKYLIFLTHWTYLLEIFQFVLAFIIVVEKAFKESKTSPAEPMTKMPWHYQMYWVSFTTVLPSAFVVTLIFWTSVYDPALFPVHATSLIEHVFNSVFLFLDFWLVSHPIKFLHFYWPMLYGFVYMFFSVVYQLSGGEGVKGMIPIYKILDWRYPGQAFITCTFCVTMLLFFFCLFCGLSLLKTSIKAKRASIVSKEVSPASKEAPAVSKEASPETA